MKIPAVDYMDLILAVGIAAGGLYYVSEVDPGLLDRLMGKTTDSNLSEVTADGSVGSDTDGVLPLPDPEPVVLPPGPTALELAQKKRYDELKWSLSRSRTRYIEAKQKRDKIALSFHPNWIFYDNQMKSIQQNIDKWVREINQLKGAGFEAPDHLQELYDAL